MKNKIAIISTDAGNGHMATAESIQQVNILQNNKFEIEVYKYYKDIVHKQMGINSNIIPNIYNYALKNEYLVFQNLSLRFFVIYNRALKNLDDTNHINFFKKYNFDVLISITPYIANSLYSSWKKFNCTFPLVTIPTDFEEFAKGVWVGGKEQYYIMGTDKLYQQAIEAGVNKKKIYKTSGLIINPKFYNLDSINKKLERQKLGLDPDITTGIVLFGGHGSPSMLKIMNCLSNESNLQMIFICGKNNLLAEELKKIPTKFKKIILTFVNNVNYYMQLADFFIGKPGPGSMSEAVSMKLPIITILNFYTMPQERYNGLWIKEKEIGYTLKDFSEIKVVIKDLLRNYDYLHSNISSIKNNSIFEINPILEEIIQVHKNH